MNIFVGNMCWTTTDAELRSAFEQFGSVATATVIRERESGRSRGFGFVEMENAEEAKSAIENLNGSELKGRKLNVNESLPKEDNQRREGFQKRRFSR